MATKAKRTLLFLSLLLFASTLALSSSKEEEQRQELEQCKQDCRQQDRRQQDRQQRWECEQQCQQKYEKERGEQGHDSRRKEAETRLQQCQQQCREGRQGQQQQWDCEQKCQQQYEQERRESRHQDLERQLEQCKQDCRQQERYQCEQQCQQQYEEERRRESHREDPQRQLEQCKQDCHDSRQEQRQCEQQCQQQYEEQKHDLTRRDRRKRLQECKKDCEQWKQGGFQQKLCELQCKKQYVRKDDINPPSEEEEQKARRNPYVFERESFKQSVKSEHGNIRVLQNFAQKSELLIGIANYRLAVLEANPNTFVVPNHFDADSVFYVVKGEGTITLIKQDQDRESYNIKQGDIVTVTSGTIIYLINRNNNKRLRIVKLLQPVSTPGQFEEFYTVGGEEPQSYYRVFSIEILEAALNTRQDQLERLFGRQRQGVIIKASQEQISALSRHSPSSEQRGVWPFGPFNLLNSRAKHSNNHGSLREANPNDYKPLKDLNIQVSFANITSGSMMAPFFNSKAIEICILTRGHGYFEMASPRLSSQQGQGQYEKVRSQVSEHTVFVVLPGRPIAIVASKEQNLEMVCFEINAEGNRMTLVAGKGNVVSKMEDEAKQLAFGVASKLVDQVFGGRQEEVFVRGPEQREREEDGRRHPLESVLEFAARFSLCEEAM